MQVWKLPKSGGVVRKEFIDPCGAMLTHVVYRRRFENASSSSVSRAENFMEPSKLRFKMLAFRARLRRDVSPTSRWSAPQSIVENLVTRASANTFTASPEI